MSHERLPMVARVYLLALWVLPPDVRRHDADEMVLAFADMWAESRGFFARSLLLGRMFGALLVVAAAEWLDRLGPMKPNSGGAGMMGWGRNLRFSVRTLLKAPEFTFTTVLLIGLGVGAVTTIFTLVDHILLRPLPYPHSERLVLVDNGSHSGPLFQGLQELNSVEAWAGASVADANLVRQGEPLLIEQAVITRGFFSLLGARPALGRLLTEDDFMATDVAVLSHGTWQRVFGSDADVLGRTIRIDEEPVTVVGVLDGAFEPPNALVGNQVDVWRPIDWTGEVYTATNYRVLEIAGRAVRGATVADIQAETDALIERFATVYPENFVDREGDIEYTPIVSLRETTVARVRDGLRLLLGAVSLLLLVACLNVAHLFLARGIGRVQEMAVRRALGAGTGGLVQQLLVESLTLSLAGGALGVLLAYVGLKSLLTLNPVTLPRASAVTLDVRVIAFAALVSVATAVLFGLVPALRSVRGDLADELKGSARASTSGQGTNRMRSALVVAEVALSLVLVAGAGLLLKSFLRVRAFDSGVVAEGVWTVPLTPAGIAEPTDYIDRMNRIETSLASLPGVRSATYGLTLPLEMTGGNRCCWAQGGIVVDGQSREGIQVWKNPVSGDFFETLGLTLLVGSVWSEGEESETPMPAVLSETLAVALFGSAQGAVGQVIGEPGQRQWRITGVAADTRYFGLDRPAPHALFLPMSRVPFALSRAHLAVRIQGEAPIGFQRTLREAVWKVSPSMPVPTVRSMEEWIDRSTGGRRFDSVLFGAFGLVALLLAAAGLYGTLLYNVRQRRRELGIRLALGAEPSSVERRVVGGGVRLAVFGSVLGLGGTWVTGRYLESRLYEVPTTDPATLATAVVVLLATAALASWLPARRAGRTNPIEILKAE